MRQHGVTVGKALGLVRMARATFYRGSRARPEEEQLKAEIRKVAWSQAAFGYRRITATLRRQGWRVNPKRVYRLYRQMDLQRPRTKKGRRGRQRPVPFAPTAATFPGQVWSLDIIADKLVSGRKLRLLNVLDLCSRYGLGSLVEHSITGVLAARHLEGLFLRHGAPRVLRRDRGPEFEAKVFQRLLRTWRVKDEPVPKAQPYDNGHMESFHGSLREELLDAELFYSLEEARAKVGNWLTWYNRERPHQSLGYRTPGEVWPEAPDNFGPPPPAGRLADPNHDHVNPTLS